MFCPECGLAMRTMDEEKCKAFWRLPLEELEGMIEEWRCSASRCIPGGSYTEVRAGVRKSMGHHGPIPDKVIVILKES